MNDSSSNLNCSVSSPPQQYEMWIYLSLSSINATTSVFSACLFCLWSKEIHRVLRRLLILLSIFEASFHSSVIIAYALALSGDFNRARFLPLFQFGLMCHLRLSLTMRNWTVAVISWSRVEAVANPLMAKQKTLFNSVRMTTAILIIGFVALILSVLMELSQKEDQTILPSCGAVVVVEYFFYAYQGIFPTILVILAMAIIIYCLNKQTRVRRLMMNGTNSSTSNSMSNRQQLLSSEKPNSSTRRERQAIQIIIALSITFSVLEMPTDIFGFVRDKSRFAELFVNILVEFDSLGNFIIYTCTTKLFRNFWKRKFRSKQKCSLSVASHTNYDEQSFTTRKSYVENVNCIVTSI